MPRHPIYIVSVNTTPKRAQELIAILIKQLEDQYSLVHLANTETIDGVKSLLENLVIVPQILICSSQWDAAQQKEVLSIARKMYPTIQTIAIPPGLNAAKGGEAVGAFLIEQVLGLGLSP